MEILKIFKIPEDADLYYREGSIFGFIEEMNEQGKVKEVKIDFKEQDNYLEVMYEVDDFNLELNIYYYFDKNLLSYESWQEVKKEKIKKLDQILKGTPKFEAKKYYNEKNDLYKLIEKVKKY